MAGASAKRPASDMDLALVESPHRVSNAAEMFGSASAGGAAEVAAKRRKLGFQETRTIDRARPCCSFGNMQAMRETGRHTDIMLLTKENDRLPAHRVMLVMASPVLKTLVMACPSAYPQGDMQLDMQSYSREVVQHLLDFIYKGALCVLPEVAPELLSMAEKLGMQDLQDQIKPLIPEVVVVPEVPEVPAVPAVPELNAGNCVQQLMRALERMAEHAGAGAKGAAGATDLTRVALQLEIKRFKEYILANFEDVSLSPDFVTLPETLMAELLGSDQLTVTSEKVLLDAVSVWCASGRPRGSPRGTELLRHVRFTQLPGPMISTLYYDKPSAFEACDLYDELVNEASHRVMLDAARRKSVIPRHLSAVTIKERRGVCPLRVLAPAGGVLVVSNEGKRVELKEALPDGAPATAVFGVSSHEQRYAYCLRYDRSARAAFRDGMVGLMSATALENPKAGDSACFVLGGECITEGSLLHDIMGAPGSGAPTPANDKQLYQLLVDPSKQQLLLYTCNTPEDSWETWELLAISRAAWIQLPWIPCIGLTRGTSAIEWLGTTDIGAISDFREPPPPSSSLVSPHGGASSSYQTPA
mmetsp:Transcript_19654/g.45574  ORF Transcript_19654/g.45574 Transcript_19654/m.45574 type:complete len:586 (+) Transcript_19654:65-1822(+)